MEIKKNEPLYLQIYHSLENSILNGELESGERLIDTKLAQEFGVSRGPIREAMRKLEQDGLLVNKSGEMYVYSPTVWDVVELYQLRIALEPLAVYEATKSLKESDLIELEKILKETESVLFSSNVDVVVKLNTLFHEKIIALNPNGRLQLILGNIRTLTNICRNTIIKKTTRPSTFLSEHWEIYHEMKAGNAESALMAMKKHLINDLKIFIDLFDLNVEDINILWKT
ncbi:MAG TPA: GntR family transcriptional regulator [Ureibacillus sp.]|nr:GntR family transcriptional regulator [Ureibacillus sp.]